MNILNVLFIYALQQKNWVCLCELQLEDIIKFGLDRLFENDENSLEDVDFATILGPTRNGEWQQESTVSDVKVSVGVIRWKSCNQLDLKNS